MRFSAPSLGATLLFAAVVSTAGHAADSTGSFFHDLTHIGDSKPERKLPPIDAREQQKKEQLFTVVGGGVSAPETGAGQVTVDESTNDISYVSPTTGPATKQLVKPESKTAAPAAVQPPTKIATAPQPQAETDLWDDVSSWFESDSPKK